MSPVYRVEIADLKAHLLRVHLSIPEPAANQTLSLPVWIPGSYMVRDFSGHLQGLQARQGRKRLMPEQIDKCTWRLPSKKGQALEASYEVYANDPSVRMAQLSDERCFFNATSVCLRVHGQDDRALILEIPPPQSRKPWILATGLKPLKVDRRGFGRYQAADYDELADSPVTWGALWHGQFEVAGVPHRLVVSGAPPTFDGQRLLEDTQKICRTHIRFWHEDGRAPFERYVFMLDAVNEGYGGLEHRNSTALICGRRDLPKVGSSSASEGYTTLRGLISHEYFHTWNVKRLRPAEFARYDYTRENYTELLWFFEGFTSYYDDLMLRRCGLLDNAGYLKLLGKTINQVLQTPGRKVQTVAQASMDAWVKYYRHHENTPNATVSYYSKGALVALCLDLTLRSIRANLSLDDIMRGLWRRCGAGPMTEQDLLAQLRESSGRSFEAQIKQWVHSTEELPLRDLLQTHGVAIKEEPDALAQRLGLRVDESAGLKIRTVLHGGAAHAAGLSAGDEWLGLETGRATSWRLRRLDDLMLYARAGEKVRAWVSRDDQLLWLPLKVPQEGKTWRLAVQEAQTLTRWLCPAEAH
ncbi:MAG: M61 family metallopeptidase [Betaproteobacteria bacterium]